MTKQELLAGVEKELEREEMALEEALSIKSPFAPERVCAETYKHEIETLYIIADALRDSIHYGWVPVEDGPPEEWADLMLYDGSDVMKGAYGTVFGKGEFLSSDSLFEGSDTVTHWALVPELPEVD